MTIIIIEISQKSHNPQDSTQAIYLWLNFLQLLITVKNSLPTVQELPCLDMVTDH